MRKRRRIQGKRERKRKRIERKKEGKKEEKRKITKTHNREIEKGKKK